MLLEVQALELRRGKTRILRDVHWRVETGQHWVILGPNGCGKTTLLKALVGYMPPSAGSLTLLGRTYGRSDWRELRLKVGLVSNALVSAIPPTERALDTVLSGAYAQLDLWASPTQAERRRALGWLRFFGIEALAARAWALLSQGERQRVLLARALQARPKLLILDEPCAGLDPVAREHFLGFLRNLLRKSRVPGLLLVTHHVEEIVPGFTHALLLREGGVLAQGTLSKILVPSHLTACFGAEARLRRLKGRYQVRFA